MLFLSTIWKPANCNFNIWMLWWNFQSWIASTLPTQKHTQALFWQTNASPSVKSQKSAAWIDHFIAGAVFCVIPLRTLSLRHSGGAIHQAQGHLHQPTKTPPFKIHFLPTHRRSIFTQRHTTNKKRPPHYIFILLLVLFYSAAAGLFYFTLYYPKNARLCKGDKFMYSFAHSFRVFMYFCAVQLFYPTAWKRIRISFARPADGGFWRAAHANWESSISFAPCAINRRQFSSLWRRTTQAANKRCPAGLVKFELKNKVFTVFCWISSQVF